MSECQSLSVLVRVLPSILSAQQGSGWQEEGQKGGKEEEEGAGEERTLFF